MAGKGHHIVVVGTSAGGLEALDDLAGQLPVALPASIFIVQHMAPESTGHALLNRLRKHEAFQCRLAENRQSIEVGTIYIAPPDNHLLLKENEMLVTKGARENRYRPGVDPLFRSAAVAYGSSVIGIILTGLLDDGTAGLMAVAKCGGVTVVQDPKDAAYPDMPQSAMDHMNVDYCVPISQMGRLIETLVREPSAKATIAERVLSDVAQVSGLGGQVPYNCPNCGGVLWEMKRSDLRRYRCHTGHSFTEASLLTSQSEKIEETLWTSLRMFEERKNLLNKMAQAETRFTGQNEYAERARDTEVHIERIRAMLLAPQDGVKDTNSD